MKNIHILPTDKPSRLHITYKLDLYPNGVSRKPQGLCKNQNIYITNSEEIKEGDWCYNLSGKLVLKCKAGVLNKFNDWKKIILTTDQDLIKDGVQAINDEFLEWFVKNPTCKDVEIDKGYRGENLFNYKIIIPKEESKQETLEEAAERILANNIDGLKDALKDDDLFFFYKGVIQCYGEAMAKWQQERSYSEEEVEDIAWSAWYESQFQKPENRDEEGFIKWFEQFKKK